MFYLVVRLTFLLAPAVVAEDRVAVTRSWALTRGSFWRSVVIGVAIFVPLIVAFDIVWFFVTADMFAPLIHLAAQNPHDPQASAQMLRDMMAKMSSLLVARWYILAPLALVFETLLYGIALGAAASAYRSQTQET
jgi:hypothetical protein